MKTRVISATVLLFLFAGCMHFPVTRILFFLAAGILCAYELSKNFEKLDANCSLTVMVVYLLASAVLIFLNAALYALVVCFVAAVCCSLFAGIIDERISGKGAFYTMGGVCYPCCFFVAFMSISVSKIWLETIILGCVSAWLCDAFALLGGRRFGKHKLAPKVSPNKTVEGSICGAIASVVGGAVVYFVFKLTGASEIPVLVCLSVAFLASSAGQIGDLAESLLKRLMGVKDFSNLIPGHGGMFDRTDSLIFSVPVTYFLLKLMM